MKKSAAVLLLFTLCTAGALAHGHDHDEFNDRSLKGTWAFIAHGVVAQQAGPVPPGVPVVTEGLVEFDDDGTCVSTATTHVGALTIPPVPSASCTFTVNANGTGSFSVVNAGSPFSPVQLAFVIVDRNLFYVISTDELSLSGEARRQKQDD